MRKRIITMVGIVLCGFVAFLLLKEPTCACGTFDGIMNYGLTIEDQFAPNDPIPAPAGLVVLSLTGKIGATNAEGRLDFDLAMLKRVRTIGYETDDPQLKRPTSYVGVALDDLLKLARVSPDATTLRAVTADGRAIDVPIDVARWPVIVATGRIDRNASGNPSETAIPLQLVFPYLPEPAAWNDDVFKIDDRQAYDGFWVQQLRSLEVR